jgi:putative polyhydroxyalkanoate system protein
VYCMPDIDIVRPHSLPITKAKALVQQAVDEIAGEHGVSSEWQGNTLLFRRSGVEGQVQVSSSEVRLCVTLGFFMKPLKGQLVEHAESTFERLFGDREAGAQPKKPSGRTARTA